MIKFDAVVAVGEGEVVLLEQPARHNVASTHAQLMNLTNTMRETFSQSVRTPVCDFSVAPYGRL
jgi:hypothetical protein